MILAGADILPSSPDIIALNALETLPFSAAGFSVVYTCHVLEHIPKMNALPFHECRRILQNKGIIRIVVPDLEQIVRNYISCLTEALDNPAVVRSREKYEWAMLELYDQCVRTRPGGEMYELLKRPGLSIENEIYARGGNEFRRLRQAALGIPDTKPDRSEKPAKKNSNRFFTRAYYQRMKKRYFDEHKQPDAAEKHPAEAFRARGEVHQWMYDRYSLSCLLQEAGFRNIVQQAYATSAIPGWDRFHLDREPDGSEWKPCSLYMEAAK